MSENTPHNELDPRRRARWIVLAVLAILLCIGLCLSLGPGKDILNSVIGAKPQPTPTEEPVPTEEVIDKAVLEPPAPPQDTPTHTAEPKKQELPTATDTKVVPIGDGSCFAACDPANPNCKTGLVCVPGASSTGSVCWSEPICHPVSEPPCDKDGICEANEDAACADCIPTEVPCVCGDGVCEQYRCNELVQNCPADCDPCAQNPNACPKPPILPCSCEDGICNADPSCGEDDKYSSYWCPVDCNPCECGDYWCNSDPSCGEDYYCPSDCLY